MYSVAEGFFFHNLSGIVEDSQIILSFCSTIFSIGAFILMRVALQSRDDYSFMSF